MMFPIKIAVMNAKNLWMLMVSAFFAFRHLAVPLHAPTNFGEHSRVLIGNLSRTGKALNAAILSSLSRTRKFITTSCTDKRNGVSGVRLFLALSRAELSTLPRMRRVLKLTTTSGAYTFLVLGFLKSYRVLSGAGNRTEFSYAELLGPHVERETTKLAKYASSAPVDVFRTRPAVLVETVHAAIACACAARFEFLMTDFADFRHGFIIPQYNDFLQAVA